MFTVYVIKSSSGKFYTGHTNNLHRRLIEHNSGLTKSTKSENGWVVVYTKSFTSRAEAMRHEKWLKSGTGRTFLKSCNL